jgi:Na+/citrate or Na+/malate symporter
MYIQGIGYAYWALILTALVTLGILFIAVRKVYSCLNPKNRILALTVTILLILTLTILHKFLKWGLIQ